MYMCVCGIYLLTSVSLHFLILCVRAVDGVYAQLHQQIAQTDEIICWIKLTHTLMHLKTQIYEIILIVRARYNS